LNILLLQVVAEVVLGLLPQTMVVAVEQVDTAQT
jgi:hypothetical protein